MPLCVANGCCNKSYRKNKTQENFEKSTEHITFHQFPRNEKRKLAWIKAMNLCVESLPKSPHLCSVHFAVSDFDHSSMMRRRLKENAMPIKSIFQEVEVTSSNHVSIDVSTEIAIRTPLQDVSNHQSTERTFQEAEVIETSLNHVTSQSPLSIDVPMEIVDIKIPVSNHQSTGSTSQDAERKRRHCSTLDHTYQQRLEDSPRKKLLRKALSNQKEYYIRLVRTLKQKNKRQEARIAQLNTILKELKEKRLLSDEHANILKTIGKSNVTIGKSLIPEFSDACVMTA